MHVLFLHAAPEVYCICLYYGLHGYHLYIMQTTALPFSIILAVEAIQLELVRSTTVIRLIRSNE